MTLWLSHLLDDPALGLELVAGRGGVDRRGPIRWAHISDTPDPTPWLEGGEVLLTTGLGVKDSPALQRRLIVGLEHRGVVAVGFGVGVAVSDVPPAMVSAADAHDLPVFTVPYEVPFIAVTRRVSHHVFESHYATLRRAVDLHRRVLAAVVSDAGTDGVLLTVAREMPSAALVAFDCYGGVLSVHDPGALLAGTEPAAVWNLAAADGGRERAETRLTTAAGRQLVVTSAPVRLGDQVEAVLAVATPEPLQEHETLLMAQGLTGLSLELARGQSLREARRVRLDELFEEVAAGRAGRQLLDRQLGRLGLDPERPYTVLCLRHPPHILARSLCTVVEDVLSLSAPPLVGRLDHAVFALVQTAASRHAAEDSADTRRRQPRTVAGDADRPDTEATAGGPADIAASILAGIRVRGWSGVVIGRSRTKPDTAGLRSALREAAVAAAAATDGTVLDVTALGLSGLLAGMRDDLGADAFASHVLGPVLDHDRRESAQLIATLRAYLDHGCRPGPAAAELHVHRHTLAYRLARIAELTGKDPRSGEHLLEFALALALLPRHAVT